MSVDKKIGRDRAGTFGRTTGGYSPKVAKMFKSGKFDSAWPRRFQRHPISPYKPLNTQNHL